MAYYKNIADCLRFPSPRLPLVGHSNSLNPLRRGNNLLEDEGASTLNGHRRSDLKTQPAPLQSLHFLHHHCSFD